MKFPISTLGATFNTSHNVVHLELACTTKINNTFSQEAMQIEILELHQMQLGHVKHFTFLKTFDTLMVSVYVICNNVDIRVIYAV